MDASLLQPSGLTAARRLIGIGYGFGNQILFLVTVWYLFWFLRDGTVTPFPQSSSTWWLRDSGLALLFAFAHSVMLVPKTRRLLSRFIPAPFYDSTFCVVTCISLLVLFFGWSQSSVVFWSLAGWQKSLIHLLFYVSWGALFYSLALTGLGYQNGWTPFYYWLLQKKAPRREFNPRGAYRWIRHPVYLSFLGLIWFTPRMTLDHAVLTLIWTGYIFYGSLLKDRRLEFFIGKAYVEYQRRVPGYPLMILGPLGRHRSPAEETPTQDACGGTPESSSTRKSA